MANAQLDIQFLTNRVGTKLWSTMASNLELRHARMTESTGSALPATAQLPSTHATVYQQSYRTTTTTRMTESNST